MILGGLMGTTMLLLRLLIMTFFVSLSWPAHSQVEMESVVQISNQRNSSKIIFRKQARVRIVKTNHEHVLGRLKFIGDSSLIIHKDTIHLNDIRKIGKARTAGRKVLGGIAVGAGVVSLILGLQTASFGFAISDEFQTIGLVAIASGAVLLIERPFPRRKWEYTIEKVDPQFLLATPYQSIR